MSERAESNPWLPGLPMEARSLSMDTYGKASRKNFSFMMFHPRPTDHVFVNFLVDPNTDDPLRA